MALWKIALKRSRNECPLLCIFLALSEKVNKNNKNKIKITGKVFRIFRMQVQFVNEQITEQHISLYKHCKRWGGFFECVYKRKIYFILLNTLPHKKRRR